MTEGLPVVWARREPPLRPLAVVATGAVALRLADRLAGPLGDWRGLGGPGWLVVVGEEPPWVDGGLFLGRDPAAPRLLVPTATAPWCAGVAAAALVDARVARACLGRPGPYAVVPGFGAIPLGAARPISVEGVAAWRAR